MEVLKQKRFPSKGKYTKIKAKCFCILPSLVSVYIIPTNCCIAFFYLQLHFPGCQSFPILPFICLIIISFYPLNPVTHLLSRYTFLILSFLYFYLYIFLLFLITFLFPSHFFVCFCPLHISTLTFLLTFPFSSIFIMKFLLLFAYIFASFYSMFVIINLVFSLYYLVKFFR